MAEIHVVDDVPLQESPAIHLLPMQLRYTGSAKVSRYFAVRNAEETFRGSNVLKSTFRGRTLRGVRQDVPEGYRGVIFREIVEEQEEKVVLPEEEDVEEDVGYYSDEELVSTLRRVAASTKGKAQNSKNRIKGFRKWAVSATFDYMTYWNREEAPADDVLNTLFDFRLSDIPDQIQRWMSWMDVAKEIHSPLSAQDLMSPLHVLVDGPALQRASPRRSPRKRAEAQSPEVPLPLSSPSRSFKKPILSSSPKADRSRLREVEGAEDVKRAGRKRLRGEDGIPNEIQHEKKLFQDFGASYLEAQALSEIGRKSPQADKEEEEAAMASPAKKRRIQF